MSQASPSFNRWSFFDSRSLLGCASSGGNYNTITLFFQTLCLAKSTHKNRLS
jgi:hypothetical protein